MAHVRSNLCYFKEHYFYCVQLATGYHGHVLASYMLPAPTSVELPSKEFNTVIDTFKMLYVKTKQTTYFGYETSFTFGGDTL
jgi:hypothetical protein